MFERTMKRLSQLWGDLMLQLLRFLLRLSYHVPYPKLTDWLWHKKMDYFYKKHPIDWIRDSGGKFPVVESMRAW